MPTAPIIPMGMCPLSSKNSRACTGVKACALLAVCMLCVSCSGKSSSERLREVEFTAQENQNNMAEVSHRVKALESRVDGLTDEVRQVNTRTYEVRNKAGRKTGMTVHAVIPPAPVVATPAVGVPVSPAGTISGAVPPHAVFAAEPNAAPQKPKAPLQAMSEVPLPMTVPGQPQATRGNPSPNLSLPPTEAVISQASTVSSVPSGTSGASTSGTQAMGTPSSMAVAPVPVAAQRSPAAQPTQRHQAVKPAAQAAIPAVQIPQAPQDSLALPPESATAPAVQNAPRTAQSTLSGASGTSGKLPSAVKGEEGAYKAALSLVMSGHSAEGRQKFNDFLQAYPSGRYAANAYYWIGESYYGQGNYPEALMSFKQVSSQFPRHHKTADALLKAGMTYQKLGDKENAQLQYKALQSDFPNSEAAGRIRRSGR